MSRNPNLLSNGLAGMNTLPYQQNGYVPNNMLPYGQNMYGQMGQFG